MSCSEPSAQTNLEVNLAYAGKTNCEISVIKGILLKIKHDTFDYRPFYEKILQSLQKNYQSLYPVQFNTEKSFENSLDQRKTDNLVGDSLSNIEEIVINSLNNPH